MKITQVMHCGVETVSPRTSLREVARVMRDQDIGTVGIAEEGRLVGILTDRDIVTRAIASSDRCQDILAGDVMTSPVVACHSDDSLESAVHLLEQRQIRRVPVLDAKDAAIGIVSLGDIAHCGQRETAAEAIVAVSAHHH